MIGHFEGHIPVSFIYVTLAGGSSALQKSFEYIIAHPTLSLCICKHIVYTKLPHESHSRIQVCEVYVESSDVYQGIVQSFRSSSASLHVHRLQKKKIGDAYVLVRRHIFLALVVVSKYFALPPCHKTGHSWRIPMIKTTQHYVDV